MGDGFAWFVMEKVDRTAFPGVAPCSWLHLRPRLLSLLDALAAIHRVDVLNRDLKPENVLVDGHGNPVLVDFGVSSIGAFDERGVTAEHELFGTRGYFAPERWSGVCDERRDLFSVGVMRYRALTDEAPWTPDSSFIGFAPGVVPDHVATICESLLAKDPDRRPRRTVDVSWAIEATPGATKQAQRVRPERLLQLRSDTDGVRRVQNPAHWLAEARRLLADRQLALEFATLSGIHFDADNLRCLHCRGPYPRASTPPAWAFCR